MTERAAMQLACPWHRNTLQQLWQQHQDGRLPHALLLCGHAGIGKERLARAFAESVMCQQPKAGMACGLCQGCRLAAAGSHPDMAMLAPEEGSKAIKIDQVRELVEFCARTPQFGGYRVVVVFPAEAMNRNAQNALLKTLEEPGSNTLLLLVSHQPGRLLPTVRSRCQQRLLPLPAHAEGLAWLNEQVGQGERAEALLALTGGAPLQALALEGSDWFASRDKLVNQMLALVAGRQPVSQVAQAFASQDTVGLLDALYSWSHAALGWLSRGREPADRQLAGSLVKLAEAVGARRLLAFNQQLARSRRALLSGSNPNRDLLFEQLLLVLVGVDADRYAS